MMSFSCDACGKELAVDATDRFVVRVEVRPAQTDWKLTEEDLEEDNLAEVSKILLEMEANPSRERSAREQEPVTLRLDMCDRCRRRFLADPFRRKSAPKFDFSEN